MRILLIGAHTDDVELGCGASIPYLQRRGHELFHVVFSHITQTSDTLYEEWGKSMEVLGLLNKCVNYSYITRIFHENRNEILNNLYYLKKDFNPHLVFTHSPTDRHQDHQVVAQETLRCFNDVSVLFYELPWNDISFSPNVFIETNPEYLDIKMQALTCYKSQIDLNRHYFKSTFISGQARMRGVQAGVVLAEAFRADKLIWNAMFS